MTNLDPENLQLPPTFLLLPVCSLTQIKRVFFPLSFLLCFYVVICRLHHTSPRFFFAALTSDEKKIGWSS